jgi:hypothetical protein
MQIISKYRTTLIGLTVFSIAMGYLESAVVVYLRDLYYPSGFDFPLVTMSNTIALTEILREAATVVMLLTVGYLAGENNRNRFAWFLYCFAIWDLFFYIFLKFLIDWPESLFTWDLLFLIPVMWTGPVIAPVIASFSMILLAFLILFYYDQIMQSRPRWFIILLGATLIFISFIWDFSTYILKDNPFGALFSYEVNQHALIQYKPASFNWWLFIFGQLSVFAGFLIPFTGTKKSIRKFKLRKRH